MKRTFQFLMVAVVAAVFASCDFIGGLEPSKEKTNALTFDDNTVKISEIRVVEESGYYIVSFSTDMYGQGGNFYSVELECTETALSYLHVSDIEGDKYWPYSSTNKEELHDKIVFKMGEKVGDKTDIEIELKKSTVYYEGEDEAHTVSFYFKGQFE